VETKMEQFPAKNPNPVLRVGKDGTVLYSNVAGEPLLHEWGVNIGEKLPSFIIDNVYRVIFQNSPEKMEVKVGNRTYITAFHPLPEEECVNIYGFDISEQKELEIALRKSEEKYRNIVETANEGIWVTDAETKILYSNQKMADMLGYSLDEIISRPSIDFVAEEYKSYSEQRMEKRRQGIDEVHENKFVRKDGSILWVLVSSKPLFDDDGKFTGVLALLTDITERKRVQQELSLSVERLDLALDASKAGIWEWDLKTNDNIWSKELWRLYGMEPHSCEPSYETWRQTIHPSDRELIERKVQEAVESGTELNIEWRVLDPDCTERWLMSRGRLLRDVHSQKDSYIGIIIDITERKKVECALNEVYEKLQIQSEELQVSNEELRVQSDELTEANVSLHENVTGFRTLAENSPDLVARFDRQNHCLYANPAFTEISGIPLVAEFYGWSANEFSNKVNLKEYIEPEMMKLSEKQRDNVFTTGKPEATEFHYTSPKGKEFYFDTIIVPEFIDDKIVSVLVLSRDITDIKNVETKLNETLDNLDEKVKERTYELEESYSSLKKSENGLAEAQRIAHLGNWDWDIVTNKVYRSEEVYRIYGLDSQIIGSTYGALINYVHPDDRNYVNNAIIEALNGNPYSIDHRILLANGEECIVHEQGEVTFDGNNIPVRMRGTVQDITERKKAEEKIKTLANAVESSNDAIITQSLDGIIASWNKGAEQIYGYSAEEIIGREVSILEPDDLKGEIKQLIQKTKQEEKIQHYETSRLKKHGIIIKASVTLSPVYDVSGNFVAVSCIARDITQSKKAEENLKSKLEELRRSNEELEQFAYVSSHDLQEPLRMISSYLQLLQRRYHGNLDDRADKYINFAVDGAFRMQNLINDLLEFSRVATRAGEPEPTDCEFVLNQVLSNLELYIKDNKATVSNDPLPEVMADNTQIAQVFQNLIINGIKFHSEESPQIHISAERKADEWVFSVQDKGIGIDPQYSE
jgi:PAS domain S-box-containing protein